MKVKISTMINRVKKAKKLKGIKEIYVPGERGDKLAQKRLKSGWIEIEKNLFSQLKLVYST